MKVKARALFVSHGGGPMPLLGDEGHQEMVQCLQNIAEQIEKPSAIVVVSAHWEQALPTVTTVAKPSLIYDYYGFPEASYHIQYPCAGEPNLAKKIQTLLIQKGFDARQDDNRGLDHGVFVPLKIMYPDADIPCIQLSLMSSLNPAEHIKLGEALQELDANVLVIGSGFSFHNLRAFFSRENEEARQANAAFEAWLNETCASTEISESERKQRLVDWAKAPAAHHCHPREEHLIPLHVCYGLAQSACSKAYQLKILNKTASMYLW